MDFTLSKKHEMARQLFKEFAENEVKPLAQEVDETEHFPEETVAKMQKLGFMGIPVPKEYGGQGCDPLTYIMCAHIMYVKGSQPCPPYSFGTGIPMKPNFCIFATVSSGKCSVSSTS